MHDRFPIFARLDQEWRQLSCAPGSAHQAVSRLDRAGQEISLRRVAARPFSAPCNSLHQRLDAMHDESLDCARRTGPCATSPPDASAINASAINASPTT